MCYCSLGYGEPEDPSHQKKSVTFYSPTLMGPITPG